MLNTHITYWIFCLSEKGEECMGTDSVYVVNTCDHMADGNCSSC